MTKIVKYSNRKLYNTAISQYVTLSEVLNLLRVGEELRVVCGRTRNDITTEVVSRALYENELKSPQKPTLEMLRRIACTPGGLLAVLGGGA